MTGAGEEQEWDAFPPGTYGGPHQAYGTPPHVASPDYGTPPNGAPGYAPPPGYAAPPSYATPPGYGPPPGYGAPPAGYGPPPGHAAPTRYGPPPGWGWVPTDTTWPHGPDRPSMATAAAVLGFVTAGLTALVCLFILADMADGGGDPPEKLFLLGFGSALGLLVGGIRLVQARSPAVLFGSALASIAILVIALLTGFGTLYSDQIGGLVAVVVLALPLPILTAVFSWLPRVRGWSAAEPPSLFDPR